MSSGPICLQANKTRSLLLNKEEMEYRKQKFFWKSEVVMVKGAHLPESLLLLALLFSLNFFVTFTFFSRVQFSIELFWVQEGVKKKLFSY